MFAYQLAMNGWTETGIRQLIQWSARISLTLFCLAFSASYVHALAQDSWSWWLMMNRKYIGISFALIHLFHLLVVLTLQVEFHPVFDQAAASSIIGGGIAYFFVLAMLLTSFDKFAVLLKKGHWKILHTAGGYWIWVVFFITYWKRSDTEPIHCIGVVMLIAVIILRLSKFVPGSLGPSQFSG